MNFASTWVFGTLSATYSGNTGSGRVLISLDCLLIGMSDDIKEIFTKGGIVVVLLFAGLIWYPSILQNADNPSVSANVISDGIVLLVYSVYPVSPLAVYVDLVVTAISSFVAAGKLGARGKGIIFAAGAGWVLANMVMTALNPPV